MVAGVQYQRAMIRAGVATLTLGALRRWSSRAAHGRAGTASFELPLVADRSAQHAAPDYYYRLAVRPIYKSYPIYAPGREPAGYMDWLAQQEPELAFDASTLETDRDWIAAGETVFEAPIGYGATFKLAGVRDRSWYEHNQIPVTRDGVMPFSRYVIRKKGWSRGSGRA